jgi:putative ABC transport system permease protein
VLRRFVSEELRLFMLRLLLRSLLWYRRTHLLVLIAVVVSTAVIAGSLITGDSIRGSLRQMTLSRLGRVSHILHSPRFVRQQLAEDLRQAVASRAGEVQIAPALILTAGLQQEAEPGVLRRASGVQLSGLDNSGWSLLQTGAAVAPVNDEIVLGYRTAEALQAAVGDEVSVWVELPASIPRDSLMGEREEVSLEIVFTVSAVLDEQAGASRFSLQVSQQLPNNAFVSLQTLQERLGLEERPVSRRTPVAAAARVNTLLISVPGADDEAVGQTDEMLSVDLQEALQKSISLTDLGMRIRRIEERGYLSVESDSMILEDQPVDAVMQAARDIGMLASPVVVYLINEFSAAERTSVDERYSMYSLAAGADLQLPLPLGPFTPESGDITQLGNDGIVLSSWLAEDLQVKVGDAIDARWHEVGSYGELPELTRRFTVRAVLPATQSVSLDRDLTPFVDGVTNVDGFDDWDQPFPMEMDRITSRDDDWWETHRATPRAFVSPETAAELWDSRFGRYTSVRIGSAGVALQADALETLEERILASVPPLDANIRSGLCCTAF